MLTHYLNFYNEVNLIITAYKNLFGFDPVSLTIFILTQTAYKPQI